MCFVGNLNVCFYMTVCVGLYPNDPVMGCSSLIRGRKCSVGDRLPSALLPYQYPVLNDPPHPHTSYRPASLIHAGNEINHDSAP